MEKQQHDIQRIKTALQSGHASCMIGAGFSFNAKPKTKGAKPFPSWRQLTSAIAERLYPKNEGARNDAVQSAGSSSGALRLAEEFESAFGRTELNRLLEELIPDKLHEPSEVHTSLLELPWVDVYTTNYDTLLDRASTRIFQRSYMVIGQTQELPGSRRPRIIKPVSYTHLTLPTKRIV